MLTRTHATSFNFEVEFIGRRRVYRSSFQNVSGLKAQTEVVFIKEGGKNDQPHKHIKSVNYQPIVLERGMTDEMDLIVLFSNQFNPALGATHHFNGVADDNMFTMRVKKKDRAGNVIRITEYRRCQVTSYEESDSNAMESGIAIERITVDYDEVFISKS